MKKIRKPIDYLSIFLCISIFGSFSAIAEDGGGSSHKQAPNIIVIMVDDMGFSDIGSYGSEIPTPNLDALANSGIKFTQFYNTARCSTTRASLLTGVYPHKAGMGYLANNNKEGSRGTFGQLDERVVTISEVLGKQGYLTASTGKWHLGFKSGSRPWEKGFQYSLNLPAGGVYYPDQIPFKPSQSNWLDIYLNGELKSLDDKAIAEDYWYGTDLWTDWGIKFVDKAVKKNQPFFLYLAHVAPHFPVMAPVETVDKYRGKYMQGWEKLRKQRYQNQIDLGLIDPSWPLTKLAEDIPSWDSLSERDKVRFDHMMAVYAASIERIDDSVGRLTNYLIQTNQLDNTLILFLSDNGASAESGPNGVATGVPLGGPASKLVIGQSWAAAQSTPFKLYKHFTSEGGIATPLIAHWPLGIDKKLNGSFNRQPAHVIDIMATALEMTGLEYPQHFEGREILPMNGISLLPSFSGEKITRSEPIFFEHEGNRAVRDGDWKLVSRFRGPWQLFNMREDRTETKDLFSLHPEIAQRMIVEYENWAQRDMVDQWIGPARPDSGAFWNNKNRRYDDNQTGKK